MTTYPRISACLIILLTFFVALDPAAARCSGEPTIGDPAAGVDPFPVVTSDLIVVQYDDRCSLEDYTELLHRPDGSTAWRQLQFDRGSVAGWRSITLTSFTAAEQCFKLSAKVNGEVVESLPSCVTPPTPPVPQPDPVEAGLIGTGFCSSNLAEQDEDHLFMSWALAVELHLIDETDSQQDIQQKIRTSGPSPQVRVTVDQPAMVNGDTSTTAFTVTRICDFQNPNVRKVWFWNLDRFYLDPGLTDAQLVALMDLTVEDDAPSYSEVNGVSNTDYANFDEPDNQELESKYMEEEVFISPDKRVLLMVPHGGKIELQTSEQRPEFVDALEQGGQLEANIWEVDGRWSGQTDRWHITSSEIHREGFPGLDKLLDQPADAGSGRPFRYAVAFHGYGRNETDFGILLGGRADEDLRCYVADKILQEAGARSGEIGFRIPRTGNASDIVLTNSRGYAPGAHGDLEGLSMDNIVNRASEGVENNQLVWGGIQLEQSSCLRREWQGTCQQPAVAGCAGQGSADCFYKIVARGVAEALRDVLLNGVNVSGSCPQNP